MFPGPMGLFDEDHEYVEEDGCRDAAEEGLCAEVGGVDLQGERGEAADEPGYAVDRLLKNAGTVIDDELDEKGDEEHDAEDCDECVGEVDEKLNSFGDLNKCVGRGS